MNENNELMIPKEVIMSKIYLDEDEKFCLIWILQNFMESKPSN
jgi:hypothetical protein